MRLNKTWFYLGWAGQQLLTESVLLLPLLVWWLVSPYVSPNILPSPQDVFASIFSIFRDPELNIHLAITAIRVVTATIVAAALGSLLALIPYYIPFLRGFILQVVQPVINATPSVGWALFGAIWLGFSNVAVVFQQVLILLPFCLINMLQAIRGLDRDLVEMGESYGCSRWQVFSRVIAPLLVPHWMGALRMAYGISWKISLVCELFGAERGIGYLMLHAQTMSDIAMVFGCCLTIVLVFMVTDRLVLEPVIARILKRF